MSLLCLKCKHAVSDVDVVCPACGAPVDEPDPLIGQVLLGQYKIVRKLGAGGFGCVYEAAQPSVSRKVAIKTLHKHLTSNRLMVARFRREGVASSKLAHHACVKVYNFGETDDGVLWLAMEFLDGKTLDQYLLEKRKLSTRELLAILRPICELLDEAHQKGVVHRDLKPENIMILRDPPMSPKVLDFGLASLLESDDHATQTGMVSGTPRYMSPEQWKGLKYTDHRADLYALGVIVYQCLSGRLPFDADTGPAWMQKHCLDEPIDLEVASSYSVTPAVKSAVSKALAKDPAHRYQSAMELYRAMEAAVEKNAAVTMVQSVAHAPAPKPVAPSAISGNLTMPAMQTAAPTKGLSLRFGIGKFQIAFSLAFALLAGIVILPLIEQPELSPGARAEQSALVAPALALSGGANGDPASNIAKKIEEKQEEQTIAMGEPLNPITTAAGKGPKQTDPKTGRRPAEPKVAPPAADPKPTDAEAPKMTTKASGIEATQSALTLRIRNIAKACFDDKSPGYKGSITIAPNGSIKSLEFNVTTPGLILKGPIKECAEKNIRGLKIQPTESGQALSFSF